MEKSGFYTDEPVESQTRLRDIFENYRAYWKWFVVGIALSMALTYLYTRYSRPLYEAKASVLIRDDEKGSTLSELSAFDDLNLLKGKNNIDNEMEVMRSRRLLTMVTTELNLNVQFFSQEGPLEHELYSHKPLKISFIDGDSSMHRARDKFTVTILSASELELSGAAGITSGKKKFGERIRANFGHFILTPGWPDKALKGKTIRVTITPVSEIVDYYRGQIRIEAVNEDANVIGLSLTDPSGRKAEDIVNKLIGKYNADAVTDKNQVAASTAAFINERIAFITRELSDVELSAEAFKTRNQLVDVTSEAGLFLSNGSENEKEILSSGTQLRLTEYMYDYLRDQKAFTDLVPANVGIADASIVEMTETYNKLVLERNRLLKSSSEKNPVIVNLDEQLYSLHRNLKESLNNLKVSLSMKLRALEGEENRINSQIASVPKYEREYRIIQRQQQIKESLYLYLLQKREETAISLAVTVANAKIIDQAYSDGNSVSPKKRVVYGIGFFAGIFLVIVIVYIAGLLDTKVKGRKDLEGLGIPYLGDVPLVPDKDNKLVTLHDNSQLSEALRIVKTNLSFMAAASENDAKVLFVSSTIGYEGKSFTAMNLAATFALSDKKVLLMGLDLRNPKIEDYLGIRPQFGVTNYITDPSLTADQLVVQLPGYSSYFVISSGPIPPNPAELLASDRLKMLLASVREQFDVIIVDTAPVGLVADTLVVTEHSDLTIYVVRNNYLDKRMLRIPEHLFATRRISNMALLLNGVNNRIDAGYGYGYGYAYGKIPAPKKRRRGF